MNIIRTAFLTATVCISLHGHAQSETGNSNCSQPETYSACNEASPAMQYLQDIQPTFADTLLLPKMNTFGCVEPHVYTPYSWRYTMPWELHEGLNMNLGLSVFTQLGKHSYSGVGFTQDLSAMYVKPISGKITIAAGGYLSNINWAHDSYRDAGLSAVIGYRFDDHWEAFLYGQKSLVTSRHMPFSLYSMQELGDRIGASVRYNVNPTMSIELSVERRSYPTTVPAWTPEPNGR